MEWNQFFHLFDASDESVILDDRQSPQLAKEIRKALNASKPKTQFFSFPPNTQFRTSEVEPDLYYFTLPGEREFWIIVTPEEIKNGLSIVWVSLLFKNGMLVWRPCLGNTNMMSIKDFDEEDLPGLEPILAANLQIHPLIDLKVLEKVSRGGTPLWGLKSERRAVLENS